MTIAVARTAAVAALTLWTLAVLTVGSQAQDRREFGRGGSDPGPAEVQGRTEAKPAERQTSPAEAPAQPDADEGQSPPAACPDRGRKLELIV